MKKQEDFTASLNESEVCKDKECKDKECKDKEWGDMYIALICGCPPRDFWPATTASATGSDAEFQSMLNKQQTGRDNDKI